MADTHETIADIIAEMRGMGNYQRYSGDHARVLAGRLEAAHRRERGDCAKLREALEALMIDFDSNYADDNDIASWCDVNVETVRKARAALAATETEGGAK